MKNEYISKEVLIETTWIFDELSQKMEISSWDELIAAMGSSGIKENIISVAEDLEKEVQSPFWDGGDELTVSTKFTKLCEKELKDVFSLDTTDQKSKLIDGITTCCGFDFGLDEKKANFCPVCGKFLR